MKRRHALGALAAAIAAPLAAAPAGYGFPISMAQEPLAAALSARRVIPLTVTVDRRGRLRQAIPGEMFEDDVMELLAMASEESRS